MKINTDVYCNNKGTEVVVSIQLRTDLDYDLCKIVISSFDLSEISFSTDGTIYKNVCCIKDKINHLTIGFTKKQKISDYECIIGYYMNGVLLNQEILPLEVKTINALPQTSMPDKNFGLNLLSCFNLFQEKIKNHKSPWYFSLDIQKDKIVVHKKTNGTSNTLVSFGPRDSEITSKDFMFTAYPDIDSFIIPLKIIVDKEQFGIYEVIQPVENFSWFAKKLVSNLVSTQ